MSQVSPRDAVLELGAQLKSALRSLTDPSPTPSATNAPIAPEMDSVQAATESVTLSGEQKTVKQVEITSLKREIGSEQNYLRQVIRNKLSEYGLPANTALSITQTKSGSLAVQGPVVNSKLERINFDLNQDQNFLAAYRAVNTQNPTLEYADNVNKLSKAYGQGNKVFDSLLSEKDEFNRLKDITLRYQSLRSQNELVVGNTLTETS